jgi:hypothetical protein
MRRRAASTGVVLAIALVVGGIAVPAVGQAAGAVALADTPTTAEQSTLSTGRQGSSFLPEDGTSLPTDSRSIRIAVEPDGDAVWRVQYRMRLDGENATASFESVESRVESNPLQFTGPFSRMMQRAAAVAANDTGREMEIRNVSVHARELPNQFGVVTYRFEWANFAATPGGTVRAGDALDGLFLASQRSSLLVEWPAGFESSEVSPDPDDERDRAVVWRGPVEFASNEPRVVLTGGNPLPVDATGVLAGSALLLVVGVVGWRAWTRRETDGAGGDESVPVRGAAAEPAAEQSPTAGGAAGSGPADDTSGAGDAASPTADDESVGSTPASGETGADPSTGAAAGAAGATDGDDTADVADTTDEDAPDEGPPAELLSDEERVLQLLEDNGGRMKQQDVVESMDWSETKTSQVVKEMREDDQIEVFRLGRENVLSLPGEMDV